jgi:PAS domain S-box-containing protein
MGLSRWGLLGQGFSVIVLALILASAAGIRYWAIFLTISTVGTIVVAVGFITDYLTVTVDAYEFMHSPAAWITAIITFVVTGFAALLWHHVLRQLTDSTRALHKQEERLRTILNTVPCVFYRCAPSKNRTMEIVSTQVETLSGYPQEDFIGSSVRSYMSIVHTDDVDRIGRDMCEAVDARLPWEISYRILRADGSVRHVYERGLAVYDDVGDVKWLDGFIIEETERKLAEEKLLEHQIELKSLTSQLACIEERERRRLAAVLHDQIGQSLVFSKFKLDAIRTSGSTGESAAVSGR